MTWIAAGNTPCGALILFLLFASSWSSSQEELPANPATSDYSDKVSILYTGKSLGALGYVRYQEEHELLTEVAVRDSADFKLVSHACWRSGNITIFLPSDEPEGHELGLILSQLNSFDVYDYVPALKSQNVLIFQDPEEMKEDLINILFDNPRAYREFPDLEYTSVRLREGEVEDMRVLIVEEEGSKWPQRQEDWIKGEINRVDYEKKSSLFELPLNFGYMGNRAVLLDKIHSELDQAEYETVLLDLGHRNGDFDVTPAERAAVDYQALKQIGYEYVVPHEFDLSLGSDVLVELRQQYPEIKWLASNLSCKVDSLLHKLLVVRAGRVRLGLIGLVDPSLELNLPKSVLQTFSFLPISDIVQPLVDSLLDLEVDVIVAISNMDPGKNAMLAEQVSGIDVIMANLSDNGSPQFNTSEVRIDQQQVYRPGRAHMIANSFDYGAAIGRLDLHLNRASLSDRPVLKHIHHQIYPVQDRISADTVLMRDVNAMVERVRREKGDLMFPAFVDIIEQEPALQNFDDITRNGRVSKELWEHFMARLIRNSAPAEISIIRKVPSFLPLIGKLHEREIRSWLWIEDEMVLLDLKGRDIIRLLEKDVNQELVTSGIRSFKFGSRAFYNVMGRWLANDAYYRIATTDVIYEGALSEFFVDALRVKRRFEIKPNGNLRNSKQGEPVTLRDYTLSELRRIRSFGSGKTHHRSIAQLLLPDPRFERLLSFRFLKPTLWTSFNKSYKSTGYESVPESRIRADDSFVIGVDGGFVLTYDAQKSALDWGLRFGFARQSAELSDGTTQITENMDDFVASMTYRFKGLGIPFQPLLRAEYDSEFTPTVNPATDMENPKQQIIRGILGVTSNPSRRWPSLELGLTWEHDFPTDHAQWGIQGRSFGRFPLDRDYRVVYSLTNNFDYYFKTGEDTERELALKYNMVHEIEIPLIAELSLSVAADFFFFKGKLDINRELGMSMLYRIGLTYSRVWKPRFQSLL